MKFNAGWKMSAFVGLLLPLLVSLGFWQLDRAEEKRQLVSAQLALQGGAPMRINESVLDNYTPVLLIGRYDLERYFLLDNQVVSGKVGYDIISPFYDQSGRVILVNRGWLEANLNRQILPEFATPSGLLSITGAVARNLGEPFLLARQEVSGSWPIRIQAIDLELMAQRLDVASEDFFVRIDAGNSGAFLNHYQPVNVSPEKHIGYAVQWFCMAFALICLFIYFGFSRAKSESKGSYEHKN